MERSPDTKAYIRRLKLLRAMHDETQPQFAKRLGIPFGRWNEYERGYLLPTKALLIVRSKIGASLMEWILTGDETTLPRRFIERLRAAERRKT
jgi:transcriptional regulator with XRE-family HTH domain